jgi:hypothetical protein
LLFLVIVVRLVPLRPLQQVRSVCRCQFFVRVVGNKVAAAQQERQRKPPRPPLAGMAAPPGMMDGLQRATSAGRPVVLPQGDSWASGGIMTGSPAGPAGNAAAWYPPT